MPKARMTALDVRAMVTDIRPLCLRLRVANVYDISSKVYVLKLSEGETKRHLVLQSGARFHLSEWKRDKQSIPSVFTMRLRKYIRTKRMTEIRQLGYDRVIDMMFGHGDQASHLIVEFYAKGNVVLTDHEYIIRSSWRQFKSDDAYAVRLNEKYPLEQYMKSDLFIVPTFQYEPTSDDKSHLRAVIDEILAKERAAIQESLQGTLKNKERKEKQKCLDTDSIPLGDLVARLCPVAHKALIDHIMHELGLAIDCRISMSGGDEKLDIIIGVLQNLMRVWYKVSTQEQMQELLQRRMIKEESASSSEPILVAANEGGQPENEIKGYILESAPGVYEDFTPIPLGGLQYKELATFHECVDQYFSSVEVGKAEKAKTEKLSEMESKIEKIRSDQTERVERLKAERDLCEKQAICVEYHIAFVARALEMMQRLVQSGSDWSLIEKLVKEQRRNNHPICAYVQSMQLKEGKFTILLQDTMYGHNDEEAEISEDAPLIPVELTISDSAFQNVKSLHAAKKQSQAKFVKTELAAQRVISQAEQAAAKLKKTKELGTEIRPQIRKIRKTFWFERFYWFISSDGYLVLGGHDAIENEILYKKYLRKEDLFVHADVHGAATCIVRNAAGGSIPQTTIDEAGTFAVCRSSAWKSKILVAAYWVFAHQVSKTPQAGEYVSTGGFIIRGQRNPIIVKKLEMGLGIYFHLGDEDSIKRHLRGAESGSGETTPATAQQIPSSHSQDSSTDPKQALSQKDQSMSQAVADSDVKLDIGPSTEGSTQQQANLVKTSISKLDCSGQADTIGNMDQCAHEVDCHGAEKHEQTENTITSDAEPDTSIPGRQHTGGNSVRVQWGMSEVLPTPAIQQRVEFDELPPEVIVVHSERSILSDDENHWILRGERLEDSLSEISGCNNYSAIKFASSTDDSEYSTHESHLHGADEGRQRRLPRESRRPDSADELPPPSTYLGRAAPKDLLAKRTPETAPMSQASDSESDFELDHGSYTVRAQTERQSHRSVPMLTSPFRETLPAERLPSRRRRRRVVDGGPPPRGFLEFEVPPVRDLLRFGSRHTVHDEDLTTARTQTGPLDAFKSVREVSQVAEEEKSEYNDARLGDNPAKSTDEEVDSVADIKDDEKAEVGSEASPVSMADANVEKSGRKRMMSKAERKMLKKGKRVDGEEEVRVEVNPSGVSMADSPANKKSQKAQPLPRGKRQKLKKMRKYEEQSDEEKEIAMKLIGAKTIKLNTQSEEETVKQEPLHNVWERAATKPSEAPDRNIAEESEDETQNEEWKKRLEVLNELTGRPVSGDTILSAIPVCAPYPALKNFTYKGRVLPGGGKKGLAVKHALLAFIEMSPSGSVERELIKQISTDEMSACLVTNPIVQIQGIDKVLKAEKQAKNAERRVNKEARKKGRI